MEIKGRVMKSMTVLVINWIAIAEARGGGLKVLLMGCDRTRIIVAVVHVLQRSGSRWLRTVSVVKTVIPVLRLVDPSQSCGKARVCSLFVVFIRALDLRRE